MFISVLCFFLSIAEMAAARVLQFAEPYILSFKNLDLFSFFSVTIVWRRPNHQYPRQQQSNSSVSLTSISKPMPKENLSTQLRLNSFFQPFLNLFISNSTCSLLNSIKLFMMSLPDCWNICGPEPWVQWLDWWGDSVLFTFFWILWHNDWWENMQGILECHYDAHINRCAQGLAYSAIHMPIFCPNKLHIYFRSNVHIPRVSNRIFVTSVIALISSTCTSDLNQHFFEAVIWQKVLK